MKLTAAGLCRNPNSTRAYQISAVVCLSTAPCRLSSGTTQFSGSHCSVNNTGTKKTRKQCLYLSYLTELILFLPFPSFFLFPFLHVSLLFLCLFPSHLRFLFFRIFACFSSPFYSIPLLQHHNFSLFSFLILLLIFFTTIFRTCTTETVAFKTHPANGWPEVVSLGLDLVRKRQVVTVKHNFKTLPFLHNRDY